nr:membrane metalloprotease [Nonlabens ulvanivorans]
MKKIFQLLCLLIILAGLNACSSDKDQDNNGDSSQFSYTLNTGASANELLSDTRFTKIVIEAVYVDGFRPEQASLNNLLSFLNNRLHKPGGISIVEREIPAQSLGNYSIAEVRQLEDDIRTQFSLDDTLTIFVLFADQSSENDSGNSVILGTAYRNTSLVMFQKTIEELSGGFNEPSRVNVETAVYEHEFAHIMGGLVNIGTPLQSDHEDQSNSAHCDVDGCLMSAQLETFNPLDMMNIMGSGNSAVRCSMYRRLASKWREINTIINY